MRLARFLVALALLLVARQAGATVTFGTVQSGQNDANQDNYVFSSGLSDPGTDNLLILFVANSKSGTPDAVNGNPTGWGLTFTPWGGANDTITYSSGASSKRMSVFRARGTTTAGNLTVDFGGGNTQLACDFVMIPVTGGFDTSGSSGAGAAGQSLKGSGTTSVAIAITMTSGNGAAIAMESDGAITGGIDPTWAGREVLDIGSTNPGRRLEAQTSDTTRTTSGGTAAAGSPIIGGIIVEIKAPSSAQLFFFRRKAQALPTPIFAPPPYIPPPGGGGLTLASFVPTLRASDWGATMSGVTPGNDICGCQDFRPDCSVPERSTGFPALTVAGTDESNNDTWLSVYPTTTYTGTITLETDICIAQLTGTKGGGVVALWDGGTGKGLYFGAEDGGSTDRLTFGLVRPGDETQVLQTTTQTSMFLVHQNSDGLPCTGVHHTNPAWLRVQAVYTISGDTVTVVGKLFGRTATNDWTVCPPLAMNLNASPTVQIGPTVTYGPTSLTALGLSGSGKVGAAVRAVNATVYHSVGYFAVSQP